MTSERIPTDDEVRAQVDRICQTKKFRRSYRSSRLLNFLLRRTLDKQSVTEHQIGLEIFDRREDWAPLLDSIVRTGRNNLCKSLEKYYSTEGILDPVWVDVPDGGEYKVVYSYNPRSLAQSFYRSGIEKLTTLFFHGRAPAPEPDFTQAVEHDRFHGLALLGRAESHLVRLLFWESPFEHLDKTEADALSALRIDEKLWRAHALLGVVHSCRGRWLEAQKAFALWHRNTTPEGLDYLWYPMFLLARGEQRQAFAFVASGAASHEEDPMMATIHGLFLYLKRQLDAAADWLLRAHRMRQNQDRFNFLAVFLTACVCLSQRNAGEAMMLMRECRAKFFVHGFYALCFAHLGDADAVSKLAGSLLYGSAAHYVPPLQMSVAHIALGETDNAVRRLGEAYDEGDLWTMFVHDWPLFDSLRKNAEFTKLLRWARKKAKTGGVIG